MRKYRYGSSYSSKPNQNWLRNILLITLVGTPLLLILLELGLKNFAPTEWLGNKVNSTTQDYELKPISRNGKPLENISNIQGGDLEVKINPISGYDLVPNQANKFWQINAQGFRVNNPVPVNKNPQDIRIFIIGNSTAFGTMAADNQKTIGNKIEQLLNTRLQEQLAQPQKFQPAIFPYFADQVEKVRMLPPRIRGVNYQVITAAVPGYTSTNELSLWAHKISEFKPDALIFLNGYEDLRSPSSNPARELINIETLLQQQADQEKQNNEQRFRNWLGSFYTVRVFQNLVNPANVTPPSGYYQVFNATQLAATEKELNQRINNYDANLRKLASLNPQIPIILAIQPEITGKKSLSNDESQIVKSLGSAYSDRITTSYRALESKVLNRKPNKVKVLSLYNVFGDRKEQIFLDPIHLTDAGNTLVAKKLFNVLEEIYKIQPQPASAPS